MRGTYWFDEVDIGLAHESVVRFEDSLDVSASLDDISCDSAKKSYVSISVYEYFQVHHISNSFIIQRVYSFEKDKVGAFNFDARWITLTGFVIVAGDDHVFSLGKVLNNLSCQGPIEGIRMIKIIGPNILHLLVPTPPITFIKLTCIPCTCYRG